MSGLTGVDRPDLLLVPYTRAIELLADRDITLTILAPPYPAAGLGPLRVVRADDDGAVVRLTATYDDYERLP